MSEKKFMNAYDGLKTLNLAEILNVISVAVAGLVLLVLVVKSGSIGDTNISSQEFGNGFLVFVAGIVAPILALCAFILQISGINKAKTDDEGFDTALMFVIGGIIVSVIAVFTSGWLESVLSVVSKILSLCVTLNIIKGIRSVACQLGKTDTDKKGGTVFTVIIVLSVIFIVLGMVNIFVPSISRLMTLVIGGFNLAKSIVFLTYLSNAVNMFGIKEEIDPLG